MNNQINPNLIVQMIQSGSNPQQIIMSFLEGQLQSTPMGVNLLNLAKNNRTAELEKIARNIVNSQGGDFDKEFSAFRQQFNKK